MKTITISTENCETYSSISNFFIDYYMADANGEFVKVYLYLVRLLNSHANISVAEIADHFNLTEQDICRAIKYWVTKEVLRLTFDGNGTPTGIVILPLSAPSRKTERQADAVSLLRSDSAPQEPVKPAKRDNKIVPIREAAVEQTVPSKHKYTATEIDALTRDEDWGDIQYQVETLFEKQVSQSDTQSLLYIYDTLGFSTDLLEYLIEYCTLMGKKSCRYMEAVAIGWYQDGIRTKIQAKERYGAMTSLSRLVFKSLGIKRTTPTATELEFFNTWTSDFGFSEEVIAEACNRTVVNAANPTIKYVNSILESWNRENVHGLSDIERLDKAYAQSKNKPASTSKRAPKANSFNDFDQTDRTQELDELARLFIKEVNNQ